MSKLNKYYSDIVCKHNNIIEATYHLTLHEMRIIGMMISKIHPEDEKFKTYSFTVKEIVDLLKISKTSYYNELKNITKKLLSRVLTINESDGILQISWLSSAKYYTKEGKIDLCFDPKLKPYLLQLKKYFTQYKLEEIIKLHSKYAFRIYEIMKCNEYKQECKYSLEKLRDMLGLTETGKLKTWKNFKARCLLPAIKEINQKTDIYVEWKPYKNGRKIAGITFFIRQKDKKFNILYNLVLDEYRNDSNLYDTLVYFYKEKGFEYCKKCIIEVNEYIKKENSNNINYVNFLIKTLKCGYVENIEYLKMYNNIKKSKFIKIDNKMYKLHDGFAFTEDGLLTPEQIINLIQQKICQLVAQKED